jgi:hypothetical protein
MNECAAVYTLSACPQNELFRTTVGANRTARHAKMAHGAFARYLSPTRRQAYQAQTPSAAIEGNFVATTFEM